MKKILLLFPCMIFAQAEPHFVNAVAKKDSCIGHDMAFNCWLDVKDFIKDKDKLSVYEYYQCDSNEPVNFYRVLLNGQPWLIKESEVIISDEDANYIKNISIEHQLVLSEKVLAIVKALADESQKKVDAKIATLKLKGKQSGILIKNSSVFDQSEYTQGTGYEFTFANLSKKIIKYIWISVNGINAVNDLVSTKTVKCVGPVETQKQATYTFDYVWFTDIVDHSKIASIKIQYMDGTFKQIQNASEIYVGNDLFEYMYGNE